MGDPCLHVSQHARGPYSYCSYTLSSYSFTKGGTKNIHIINFIWVWRVLGGDVLHTRAVDMMMMVRVT